LSALSALPLAGWGAHATHLRHRLARARRDPLTALPTREQFTARATLMLRTRPALVVLTDLDRFKPLNDALGHAAGDAALREVGARLASWARGGIAARLGGDEFAAALPTADDPAAALAALHEALTCPIPYRDTSLEVGASVGGHLAARGTPLAEALGAADAAMYTAKINGGGWRLTTGDRPHAAPGRWRRARPRL
jgi:diguanylate cyclase (GGDEF)-like protein